MFVVVTRPLSDNIFFLFKFLGNAAVGLLLRVMHHSPATVQNVTGLGGR